MGSPKGVDQPIDGHGVVRIGQEQGEDGPLPRSSELDRLSILDDLERSQDPKFHVVSGDDASTAPASQLPLSTASASSSKLVERKKQRKAAAISRREWHAARRSRIVVCRVEAVSTHTEVEIGAEFLGYRIDGVIGRGGMGVVYRAYDLRLKRTVALKLVAPELALDERFRARFARETELAMSLEHPNVVPIYDAGEVDGRLYLAMRYVEGADLRTLLRADAALEPGRAVAISGQVAAALDAAHARGLVHRDVKPSNVLLDEGEHIYLADFGLTRRLEEEGAQPGEGRSVGTPSYLAPEQIEGGPVDGQADVYSLGCLLYECLTGEVPFSGDSRLAVAWAHLEEEPPSASERNPDLPRTIDAVLRKAMAKSPEERYPTCATLAAAAADALGLRRRRRLAALVALVVLIVVIAVVTAVAALFLSGGGAPLVTDESLVEIDGATDKIVEVFPVGRDPREVERVGNYVFVASESDGSLTRVDRRTGAVITSGQYDATDGLAGEGEGRLWVSSPRRGEVTAVDAELPATDVEEQVQAPHIPLTGHGDVGPASLAVGGGSLWIAAGSWVERWRLHPLQLEQRYRCDRAARLCGSGMLPGDHAIAVAFGYGAAWVVLGAPANALLRIDARSGRATRVPIGSFPRGVAIGFGSVWVTMAFDNEVWRIDPATGRARKIAVGEIPWDVAVGPDSVWVTNNCHGTVSRIDPRTNTVVKTIEIGYHPRWLTVGGGSVWVGVGGQAEEEEERCP
jgi:YVTN family beta-propeller protein